MHILREMALEQQQRLMDAMVMTAGREKGAGVGGHVYELATQISALNQWIRLFDSGVLDFNRWAEITHQAGFYFDEWYDWYQREYSTPHEALFNVSIDEWCKLGGMAGIEEVLRNSPAAGKDAA